MHAGLVETVPAGALRVLAVAIEISLATVLIYDVVLARHVMDVEFGLTDHLLGIVEFRRARKMGDVAGVDHEARSRRQRADLVDRLLQRAEGVRIGRLVEANMTVADLQEGEGGGARLRGFCIAEQIERFRHAARNSPEHAGAGPDHAFECVASIDAVLLVSHVLCSDARVAHGSKTRAGLYLFPEMGSAGDLTLFLHLYPEWLSDSSSPKPAIDCG